MRCGRLCIAACISGSSNCGAIVAVAVESLQQYTSSAAVQIPLQAEREAASGLPNYDHVAPLSAREPISRISKSQADRGALPALLALTEHSQPVHRAKAVVAAGLLCRDSPVALLACCEVRIAKMSQARSSHGTSMAVHGADYGYIRCSLAGRCCGVCWAVLWCYAAANAVKSPRSAAVLSSLMLCATAVRRRTAKVRSSL